MRHTLLTASVCTQTTAYSLLLSLFFSPIAFAKESKSETDLDAISVVADEVRTSQTEQKKSYTTSAMSTTTGLLLTPKETPQSVSVVTNTQLKDQGITNMEDALRSTTGVTVVRDSGKYRYKSRGFYIDQIQEDGISTPVSGGNSGNPYRDAQSMSDLVIYDHIEVVRGPTGLTQAISEPGGTINAVRKKPTTEFQASGNFLFDRFGRARATADISGALNQEKTVRGRLIAMGDHNPTYKDTSNNNKLVYGVLEADVGSNSVFTLGAMMQNKHETPDYYGVPMAEGGSDAGFDYDSYLGYNWNKLRTRKFNVFSDFTTYLGDTWKISHKINYVRNHSVTAFGAIYNAGTTYAGLPVGGTLATGNLQRYDNFGEQFGYSFNTTGKYDLFSRQHDLFIGYSYSYSNSETQWRRVRNSTAYDPYTFSGSEIAEPNWDTGYNDRTYYTSKYIEHGINLGTRFNIRDDLHLLVGGRYTNYRRNNITNYDWWNNRVDTDPDLNERESRSRVIPFAGITYDITPIHSVYFSYASIFKPQSNVDMDNKTLAPIIGTNYEVGVKSDWFNNGKLNTSIAAFRLEQENRAISTGLYNSAGNLAYEQSGKVRSRGIDVEISGALTENWNVFAGYTFNMSEYRNTESTRYTQGLNFSKDTPKHMFRLYTNYRLPFDGGKWTIGGGVNAQTETASVYDVKQGGYAVWNANIQYDISDHIKLSLIGTNLTDKRYYDANRVRVLGANNFIAEPRNVVFMLDWKF